MQQILSIHHIRLGSGSAQLLKSNKQNPTILIAPKVAEMDLSELWAIFGPGVAGAVFGAGWWFWVDAVVCSSVSVSFVHYLPGQSLFFFVFCFWFLCNYIDCVN